MVERLPEWLAQLPAEARLGAVVEHTLLRPGAGLGEVRPLCAEARGLGLRAVCVHGQWLAACRGDLAGSGVLLVVVADFPEGRATTDSRVAEVARLAEAGADEIDIVAPAAAMAAGDWPSVDRDLRAVIARAARPVKVILETAALDPAAIAMASRIARDAGAFAVKTSTGFHQAGGAGTEAVAIMRKAVGTQCRVKASGGIRTVDQALQMLSAGADLIGTSAAARWPPSLGPGAPPLAELLRDSKRGRRASDSGP